MSREYQVGEEVVPGFRLSGFLGRGGFGQVWRCLAPGGAELALKIIDLDREEGLREYRALRLVKRIRHANLVPVVACWLRDSEGQVLEGLAESDYPTECFRGTLSVGRPAELVIAMSLGEKNLLDRLHECQALGQQGIPPAELFDYLEDAARGLDFLNSPRHDLGNGPVAIQHCDIKPQNILIGGAAAQVCDFGLARVLSDVRQTRAMVSVAYAAPECIKGNPPSATTDQYSLAISFVELRTGRLPFADDASAAQILRAHLDGALDLAGLTAEEQAVIRRATALDPEMRYPSALHMVRALRKACGVFPSVASTEARTQAAQGAVHSNQPEAARGIPPRASRARPIALAAAIAVLVAGSLLWLAGPSGPLLQAVALPLGLALNASLAPHKEQQAASACGHTRSPSQRRRQIPSARQPARSTPTSTPTVASRIASPSRPEGSSTSGGSSSASISEAALGTDWHGTDPICWNWLRLARLALAARASLSQWPVRAWNVWAPRVRSLLAHMEAAVVASDECPEVPVSATPGASSGEERAAVSCAPQPNPDLPNPGTVKEDSAQVSPIEQAREAAEREDLSAALRLATLAIEQTPHNAALYTQRAAWSARQRAFEQALADLEQARSLAAPGSVDLLFARLRVRVRIDNCPLVCAGKPVIRLATGTELVVIQAEGEWLYVETDALGRLPADRGHVQKGWLDRDDVEAIFP